MIKRVCAAAVIGLFTSAVLGQSVGNTVTTNPQGSATAGASAMVGAGPQGDRERRTGEARGSAAATMGAGGTLQNPTTGGTPGAAGSTGTTASGSASTTMGPAEGTTRSGSFGAGASGNTGA